MPEAETRMVHAYQSHKPQHIAIAAHMLILSAMLYAEQSAQIARHFDAAGFGTQSRCWFVLTVIVALNAFSIGNIASSDTAQIIHAVIRHNNNHRDMAASPAAPRSTAHNPLDPLSRLSFGAPLKQNAGVELRADHGKESTFSIPAWNFSFSITGAGAYRP